MKTALMCTAMLMAMVLTAPAMAEDGQLSKSLLADLGLSSMQSMSDSDGTDVRGMSSSTFAFGSSLVFGQLVDNQNPGNFIIFSDVNGGRGSDENAGLSADSLSTQGPHGSSGAASLDIQSGNPAIQVFLGSILANAGHAANLGAAGISAATGN